jgi:signal transduction histidine kinase
VSVTSGDEAHLPGASPLVVARLRGAATAGVCLVAVVAVSVLAGWALDVGGLKRVASGFAPMKVNAALCYLLLALVLLGQLHPQPRAPRRAPDLLLAVVGLISGLTLIEHLLGVDLRIDQLLVHDGELGDAAHPGLMSYMGATVLVLLCMALLALRRGAHLLAQWLAVGVVIASAIGLLGYLYGVDQLYELDFFRGLAVHSAVCLLVLALCLLFADADTGLMVWVARDSPDGSALRVVLPTVFLAPVTQAYLVVKGESHHWVALPVGAAISVPVTTVVSVLFLGLIARRLLTAEAERRAVTAALTAAHEELARRVEYAGIVAHDLRNPLSAILVYGRLLQRESTQTEPGRVERHAATIVKVAESMGVILDDILSVASLEAGTLALEHARLELVDFLDAVQQQAEAAYPHKRIKADVSVGELWVEADAVQLARVLLKLLSNAVKFSPPECLVSVELLRDQGTAVLRVVDHGPGVSADDLPKLFEKFSRLPSGAKVEGSGLGLYICRSIVEAHGGRLWAEATPGGGATFCMSLPAVTRRHGPGQPKTVSRVPPGGLISSSRRPGPG